MQEHQQPAEALGANTGAFMRKPFLLLQVQLWESRLVRGHWGALGPCLQNRQSGKHPIKLLTCIDVIFVFCPVKDLFSFFYISREVAVIY